MAMTMITSATQISFGTDLFICLSSVHFFLPIRMKLTHYFRTQLTINYEPEASNQGPAPLQRQ